MVCDKQSCQISQTIISPAFSQIPWVLMRPVSIFEKIDSQI